MERDTTSADSQNQTAPPSYDILQSGQTLKVKASGRWTIHTVDQIDDEFLAAVSAPTYQDVEYDFSDLGALDMAGANILARAIRRDTGTCCQYELIGGNEGDQALLQMAANAVFTEHAPEKPRPFYDMLVRTGQSTEHAFNEAVETVAFLGRFSVVLVRQIFSPSKIRWRSVVALIEDVGLNAAPIIMLLSFFIGAVVAYMGISLLAAFGAQIYVVDLIAMSVFREFGVLIMAIMLAGRSDSAFTAQIGSMKMRQEIDAMTVMGMDTFETLVIPRAIACVVSAPVLTFLSIMAGVGGGMLVAWAGETSISPVLFQNRMQQVMVPRHFWVGMVKAPVFGLIVAMIGCRQGLAVKGSVESLGSRTTTSVVQAIFTVIAADAIFAIIFYNMGI